jgi:hypothetical protein
MKIFSLAVILVIFGIIVISGCTQTPPKETKKTELIIFETNKSGQAESMLNEMLNETVANETVTVNKTAAEPVTEMPKEDKPPACDEGKIYSVKCTDSTTIEQQKCVNGKIEITTEKCKTDYLCSSAVCVPDPAKCVDSDNGENITAPGKVLYNGQIYEDYCMMGDIVEYYCLNNKVQGGRVQCPAGTHCTNGSCEYWAPTCTKKGNKVTVDDHTFKIVTKTDYCKNYGVLTKYSCMSNGSYDETWITCASDEWCSSETLSCEKKMCNNGYGSVITKDIEKPDGVYYKDTLNSDYCFDNVTIVEVYCDGNVAKNATLSCPTGYICQKVMLDQKNTETEASNPFYSAYCEFVNG